MKRKELSRRDFTKLTTAAFGGMVAGSMVGCGDGGGTDVAEAPTTDASLLLQEPHVCRGLNACNNKGAGGENACAGQGTCATVAKHECAGSNDCKGQGGCKETAGQNACKGKGECAVPLGEDAWKKARGAFEKSYADANEGKAPGAAPDAG